MSRCAHAAIDGFADLAFGHELQLLHDLRAIHAQIVQNISHLLTEIDDDFFDRIGLYHDWQQRPFAHQQDDR